MSKKSFVYRASSFLSKPLLVICILLVVIISHTSINYIFVDVQIGRILLELFLGIFLAGFFYMVLVQEEKRWIRVTITICIYIAAIGFCYDLVRL